MSDKIPGSSYDNPIWYKTKWRIYIADYGPFNYAFVHDSFDGAEDAGDNRYGHGHTIEECQDQIDEKDE